MRSSSGWDMRTVSTACRSPLIGGRVSWHVRAAPPCDRSASPPPCANTRRPGVEGTIGAAGVTKRCLRPRDRAGLPYTPSPPEPQALHGIATRVAIGRDARSPIFARVPRGRARTKVTDRAARREGSALSITQGTPNAGRVRSGSRSADASSHRGHGSRDRVSHGSTAHRWTEAVPVAGNAASAADIRACRDPRCTPLPQRQPHPCGGCTGRRADLGSGVRTACGACRRTRRRTRRHKRGGRRRCRCRAKPSLASGVVRDRRDDARHWRSRQARARIEARQATAEG